MWKTRTYRNSNCSECYLAHIKLRYKKKKLLITRKQKKKPIQQVAVRGGKGRPLKNLRDSCETRTFYDYFKTKQTTATKKNNNKIFRLHYTLLHVWLSYGACRKYDAEKKKQMDNTHSAAKDSETKAFRKDTFQQPRFCVLRGNTHVHLHTACIRLKSLARTISCECQYVGSDLVKK